MIATNSISENLREPDSQVETVADLPLATVDYSDIDEASIPVLHEAVDAQGFSDADLGSDIDLATDVAEVEIAAQVPSSHQSTTEMKIDLGYAEADSPGKPVNPKRFELQPPRGLSQFIFNVSALQTDTPPEFNSTGTATVQTASAPATENPMPVTHPPI